ncbi:MAG: hypothetical protein DWI22_02795 [Planctomycetota bacterium]|nr:MAG: hypothetical protein DWI22_02795 [Planctomycetota bacterium]
MVLIRLRTVFNETSNSIVQDSLVVPALAGKLAECSWFGRLNFRLKAGLRTKQDRRTDLEV